jgi:hypothetical protein
MSLLNVPLNLFRIRGGLNGQRRSEQWRTKDYELESEHFIFLYPGYPMEKSDSQLSISIEVSLDICLNLRSQAITHFVLFLLSSLIF